MNFFHGDHKREGLEEFVSIESKLYLTLLSFAAVWAQEGAVFSSETDAMLSEAILYTTEQGVDLHKVFKAAGVSYSSKDDYAFDDEESEYFGDASSGFVDEDE